MKAVDTNILVYAHRREAAENVHAFEVIRQLATGPTPWAIAWPCLYEFYSVVTNRKIWGAGASTPAQACAQINTWLACPSLLMLSEPINFAPFLTALLDNPRIVGPVVHDARIAALCLIHGVTTLITRDRDFSLFPQLTVENPFGS